MSKPAITVVLSTYNWSAALRCAIRSVLLQTMPNFEVLVVGDGCTDDSETVVSEFRDPRLRWHNLERNYGSQWAPNNYGNEHASGDWIAYLGHDDIWHPTHLAAILDAAHRKSADVVTSVMIAYWPPSTAGRSIAGLFPSGAYAARDFVPPSALAHSRAMYGNTARWRDPDEISLPMDVQFLDDLAASGGKFTSTGEITCFKFNAAWRRDAYRIKSVEEQERMLRRIESGVDFRAAELLDVLQSVVSGQFWAVAKPSTAGIEKGFFVNRNRQYKGLRSRHRPAALRRIEQPVRFDMSDQNAPFEWHDLEQRPDGISFRWTGPSTRATIDLPIIVDRDLIIEIDVVATLRPDSLESVKLTVHGHLLTCRVLRKGSEFMLEAEVPHSAVDTSGRDFGVTIETDVVTRPCDLGINEDTRWLGIAVSSITVLPLLGGEAGQF